MEPLATTTDPGLDPDRDPVEALADEFVARRRRGEAASIEEYAARLPERADEIRALFPTIAAMERLKPHPTPNAAPGGSAFPPHGRLGDLRLIREIGRGGMGVVYEAEQESLGRRVAVKVLPQAPWADDRPMRRFLREAKTTAGLRHGHIVPVFAVGREGDLHYYVMPLIAGVGLDRVIAEVRRRRDADGPVPTLDEAGLLARTLMDAPAPDEAAPPTCADGALPSWGGPSPTSGARPGALGPAYWRAVARIGKQAAGALHHAHEQGVLHRDVKPANLLLDADGIVWVADFGLAKAASQDDLSRTGDLVGTLRYMPPERFRGESDARGDIYSLGLTLYELMTLRPAHGASDRAEAVRLAAEAAPPGPREIDPSIPIDLETIVLKAIDPDPSRRYPTALALAEDLERFEAGEPIRARRASRRERVARWVHRNRAVAALAAVSTALALVAAVFIVLFLMAPPQPRRPPMAPDYEDVGAPPPVEERLEPLRPFPPPHGPPPGGPRGGPPPDGPPHGPPPGPHGRRPPPPRW